jgi:regulator of cell morphogenesis and NO signaling
MKMTKNENTVGEIVATIPHATRVFQRLGIDYCCGGGQSLANACKEKGMDLNDVLGAINAADAKETSNTNYYGLNQLELTEHIINTHHAFTRNEIERLSVLIQKVVSVHGARHPELLEVQKTFCDLADDLLPHMMKEENVLFPYVVKIETAIAAGSTCPQPAFMTVQNPIRMMQFEHDLAGQLLRELRRITSNYTAPADSCVSYKALYGGLREFEEDLHLHIHLENNILFPRAIDMETQAREPERTAS